MTVTEAKRMFQDLETGLAQNGTDKAHVRNRIPPAFSFRPTTKHILQLVSFSLLVTILHHALNRPTTKVSRRPTTKPLPETCSNSTRSNPATSTPSYDMGLAVLTLGAVVVLVCAFFLFYALRKDSPVNAFLNEHWNRRQSDKEQDHRHQGETKAFDYMLEERARELTYRRQQQSDYSRWERETALKLFLEERPNQIGYRRREIERKARLGDLHIHDKFGSNTFCSAQSCTFAVNSHTDRGEREKSKIRGSS